MVMTNFNKFANPRILLPAVAMLGAVALLTMPPAKAVETAAETDDLQSGRYELQRDGDDFIRLDKRSGQMSICRKRSGQLVCRMAADDREAIEEEFDSLLDRLDRTTGVLPGREPALQVHDRLKPHALEDLCCEERSPSTCEMNDEALVLSENGLEIGAFRIDPELQHAARRMHGARNTAFPLNFTHVANVDDHDVVGVHQIDRFGC